MKTKFNILMLLVLGGALFFLTTCKQPNANPCAGAKEPTAAFTMMETTPVFYFSFTPYDCDTVGPGWVQFTALEPNAKYEWRIGTDTTVFTKQQFMLNFNSYWTQYQLNVPPVTITLKVTKYPGNCFPASDSVKYMTRTMYLTNKYLLNGIFKGHFNYDTAVKIISVNVDTLVMDPQADEGMYITGLPNKDSLFISFDLEAEISFYRKGTFNFVNSTYPPYYHLEKGEMMVTSNGEDMFLWMTQNNPKISSTYTFTGTRI